MTKRLRAACATTLLSAPFLLPLHAAELSDRWDATVSARTDLWSGSRNLDEHGHIATGSLWVKSTLKLGDEAGKVFVDGWLRDESRSTQAYTPRRLRELYWRGTLGPVDLKVGRQITAWGRADGINPTDKLSPRDFTLLAPEDGDQRYGNEAVKASIDSGNGVFSAWAFLRSASDTIPLTSLPMVRYEVAPVRNKRQWALRWDHASDGLDSSVSYFDGFDPMPDLNFAGFGPDGVRVRVTNHRVRMLGADLSLTQGSVVWRAEAAITRTENAGAQDFDQKRSSFMVVGGPEWSQGDITLGSQLVAQWVFDYVSPDTVSDPILRDIAWRQAAASNQPRARQYGLVLRLAARWLGDNLLTEISGIALGPRRNAIVRTKVDYALDDHWHVQAGSETFFGDQRTFFGQLRANRLAYLQLRYAY